MTKLSESEMKEALIQARIQLEFYTQFPAGDDFFNQGNRYVRALLQQTEENEKLLAGCASLRLEIETAVKYLHSCGYERAHECEPERQMLESFKKALSSYSGQALLDRLKRYEGTLSFYALDSNYVWGQIDDEDPTGPIMEDGGERARKALQAYDSGEKK